MSTSVQADEIMTLRRTSCLPHLKGSSAPHMHALFSLEAFHSEQKMFDELTLQSDLPFERIAATMHSEVLTRPPSFTLSRSSPTASSTQGSQFRAQLAAAKGLTVGGQAQLQPLFSNRVRRTRSKRSRLRARALSEEEKGKTPPDEEAARNAVSPPSERTNSDESVTNPNGPPEKLARTRVARPVLDTLTEVAPSFSNAFFSCSPAAEMPFLAGHPQGTISPALTALGELCKHPASSLPHADGTVIASVRVPRAATGGAAGTAAVGAAAGGDGGEGGGGGDGGFGAPKSSPTASSCAWLAAFKNPPSD